MFARAASNYVKHSATCCAELATILTMDQGKVLKDCCNRILDLEEIRIVQNARMEVFEGNRKSLFELIRRFRDRKASDPRDKVYALLSLAQTPLDRSPLIPDYSLSEVDVFRQVTLETIYLFKSLSFSTELGRTRQVGIPTEYVRRLSSFTTRAQTLRLRQ